MAFGIGPVLTMAAIDALASHGSDDLKARYLAKLISGEWMGTMQLTEPQAGSDVGALRTKAERAGDGTYRITGSKIFITYGEHDLTDNIIHFVLARLPDAPPGTKGISLFLVPKVMPDGTRNDVRAHSIEHKLGIHASPTCTMVYGDKGGAIGFLIGARAQGHALHVHDDEPHAARGRPAGRGDRRTARRSRRSPTRASASRAPAARSSITPTCKRMLLTMRALDRAPRARSATPPRSRSTARSAARREAARKAGDERASLLTPVAKAFSTDIGIEVASLGVQVHGGMGFIEETGAAQHYRDARIAAIYEGTNGIQAIDLVTRKVPLDGGKTVAALSRRIARHASKAVQGEQRAGLRRDRRRGWAKRSTASSAPRIGCWRRNRPTRRSPARRLTCGCSAAPPAAACSPTRRSPRLRESGDGAARVALDAVLCRKHRGAGRRPRTQRHRRRRRASPARKRRWRE